MSSLQAPKRPRSSTGDAARDHPAKSNNNTQDDNMEVSKQTEENDLG